MGTAIIQSHLGSGLYRVKLQFDNALVQGRIAAIDARLVEITAKLAELATAKTTAKTKLDADVLALNVYIDATPSQDYAANPAQIDKLTAALYESKSAYDLIVSNENREKLQKAGLQKDKTYLTKYCPAEITTDIWCVQRVTSLSGTIKTIECDYGLERDPDTNGIKFDTGCWLPYQATPPDSKLQHPMATSQHANWFNLSMLPAAQKDKARYRVATVISVATGRVQFDGQYNTEEHTTRLANKKPVFPVIGGAQREFQDGVTFYYPCGMAGLYVNGDRVIVDLHNGVGNPTVIGFYANPRACVPDATGPNFTAASNFSNVGSTEKAANSRRVISSGSVVTYVWRTDSDSFGSYQDYVVYDTARSTQNIQHFEQDFKIGTVSDPSSRPTLHVEFDLNSTSSFTGTMTSRTTTGSSLTTYSYQTPIDSISITSTTSSMQTIDYTYGATLIMDGSPNIDAVTITTSSTSDVKTVQHMSYVDPAVGINAYTYQRVVTVESGTQTFDNVAGTKTASGGVTVTTYYITVFDDGRIFSKHSDGLLYEDVVAFSEVFTPYSTTFTPYTVSIFNYFDRAYAPAEPPIDTIPSIDTTTSPTSYSGLIGPTSWPKR